MVFLTALLALATFLLWLSTASLAKGAENTAQWQLRAYVSGNEIVDIQFITDPDDPDKQIKVEFKIKNTGQTPAHEMESKGMLDICPYPLPANYSFPTMPDFGGNKSKSVLFPNGEHKGMGVNVRRFTDEEIQLASAGGNQRMYLFALIDYLDVFGKPHTTTICLHFVGDVFGTGQRDIHFVNNDRFNTAT